MTYEVNAKLFEIIQRHSRSELASIDSDLARLEGASNEMNTLRDESPDTISIESLEWIYGGEASQVRSKRRSRHDCGTVPLEIPSWR
jgi:hypothetical protein